MPRVTFLERCLSESITEYSLKQPSHPFLRLVLILFAAYVLLFPRHYVINGVSACLLVAYCLHQVTEETLTVIKDFGVQLKTKYWLGFENNLFIGTCDAILLSLVVTV